MSISSPEHVSLFAQVTWANKFASEDVAQKGGLVQDH